MMLLTPFALVMLFLVVWAVVVYKFALPVLLPIIKGVEKHDD